MDKSLELEIIEKLIRLLKYSVCVMCVMFVCACVAFTASYITITNFLSQYEYSTVAVDGKDGGDAVYQNSTEGDNIINGESNSEKNGKKETKEN